MRMLRGMLVMLLARGLICAMAESAEPTEYISGDWKYTLLEDGTAEITRYAGDAQEAVVPA